MVNTILARTRVRPSGGKAPRASKKSVAFTVTSETWEKCFAYLKKHGAHKRGVFQEAERLFLPKDIGPNTLKRRWEKGYTGVSATGVKQLLPISLEDHLVHWLTKSQESGFCISTEKLRE